MFLLALVLASSVVFENEYVVVNKNAAPCAKAETPGCGERVVLVLGPALMGRKMMARGDIVVIPEKDSYTPPSRGDYLEANFKPEHPPVKGPPEQIAPEKNTSLYDGPHLFIFEEKLPPGETRARHSHAQRLIVVLNATKLQQWPDGGAMVMRDQVPDDVHFNQPVIHVVKTVGDKPLRNIVMELKP